MKIDINELCMIQYLGYRAYFESLEVKVFLYVLATDQLLQDNPQMIDHVISADDLGSVSGFVIFNVNSMAAVNQRRDNNYLLFEARFKGQTFTIRILLGDIVGIGPAGDDMILLDPTTIIMSPLCGSLVLRPYSAAGAVAGEIPPQPPEPPAKRPALTVVK